MRRETDNSLANKFSPPSGVSAVVYGVDGSRTRLRLSIPCNTSNLKRGNSALPWLQCQCRSFGTDTDCLPRYLGRYLGKYLGKYRVLQFQGRRT